MNARIRIRKCSIYVDSCTFPCNGTVEGLHHSVPGYLRCEPPGEIGTSGTITSNIFIHITNRNDLESFGKAGSVSREAMGLVPDTA